jgi:hypothetical protein
MDDSALLGVNDGEKVGLLDAGSLVQAHEVEELFRGRPHRLLRRAVERGRSAMGHPGLLLVEWLSQTSKTFDSMSLALSRELRRQEFGDCGNLSA